ncbi:hypothetical protein NQ317_008632 [Molorchus minor]|uniref:PUM-HD domain-containing protein n=1 Tax=Molorchus minor TaxID=1323400 RepID=A0ABQ9K351_9CUCU|nr:hypothetical protein NQ317_008632 [Molorchus minor]
MTKRSTEVEESSLPLKKTKLDTKQSNNRENVNKSAKGISEGNLVKSSKLTNRQKKGDPTPIRNTKVKQFTSNAKKIQLSSEETAKNVEEAFAKSLKTGSPTNIRDVKVKQFSPKTKGKPDRNGQITEKVEDWVKFKKEKKELKLKRKQGKSNFDIVTKAKRMGEDLRRKTLKGGEEKRAEIINQLHNLLKGHYTKFVLAHDTARIVQWLLKYASNIVVQQISKELIPSSVDMLQSKYGIHCVKRLLKYGTADTRSQIIDCMYGHAVKLASHAVSSPVFEYAYSTWATPIPKTISRTGILRRSIQKQQGPRREAHTATKSLKLATLSATKANLVRILNKSLLNSCLVHTVLHQFLSECTEEDRKDMVSQLAAHIVIISNSKDGVRAAMQCIWHGNNKDRKVIIKKLKEDLVELSKHEHGHCTIVTLLDSADDTVLLNKIIISELLKHAKDLAVSECGRKVLLWLVAPEDSTIFHPVFINELKLGREASTSKKSPEIRQKEILGYAISPLLELIEEDAGFWLSNASLAIEMNAIVKAGAENDLAKVYESIAGVLVDPEWKIKEKEKEILGIEHGGIHMMLKKLAQRDKMNLENGNTTFGSVLVGKLNEDVLAEWIKFNRGCFLLVTLFENSSDQTQETLKAKLTNLSKKA